MTRAGKKENRAARRVLAINLAVLLGLCSLLPALFVNSAAGFFPFCLFAAGLLCAFGAAAVATALLRVRVCPPDVPAVRGEPCTLAVTVQNRALLPLPCVRVEARWKTPDGRMLRETWRAPLTPGQTARLTLRTVPAHTGVYTCARVRVAADDLTSLFTLRRRVRANAAFTVGPRVRAAVFAPAAAGAGTQTGRAQARGAAAGFYSGVRDYAAGDPLRGIHWKLTAHTGAFLSRVYESAQKPPFFAALCLTPGSGTAQERDALLEQPLCAARAALDAGCDVTLIFEENGAPVRRHAVDARALETLGRRLAETGAHTLNAVSLLAALPGNAGLFCTAGLTDALQGALIARARAGGGMALLWVTALEETARETRLAPLRAAGVAARAVFCPPPAPAPSASVRHRKRGHGA